MLALACAALARPRFVFWPPPEPTAWQSRLFRALFRVLVYGLVALTATTLWRTGAETPAWRLALGAALMVTGIGAGFAATFNLGWRNAFGAQEGLRTTGWFARSRNPVYVATWVGLAGWALLVPTPPAPAALGGWALLYVLAVPLEERWLARRYGDAFADWRARTPRFL